LFAEVFKNLLKALLVGDGKLNMKYYAAFLPTCIDTWWYPLGSSSESLSSAS
jgi:hypothetical protein